MATFTFRIPDDMAGRLSSAEMRSWLSQFLRNPHPLPPDPGSGNERTSLTLPRELVRDISGFLRCPPSQALRRLAMGRLVPSTVPRIPGNPMSLPAPLPRAGNTDWRRDSANPPVMDGRSREDLVRMAVAQGIVVVITLALVFLVMYLSSKRKKHA